MSPEIARSTTPAQVEGVLGSQAPDLDFGVGESHRGNPLQSELEGDLHPMLTVEDEVVLVVEGDRLRPPPFGEDLLAQPLDAAGAPALDVAKRAGIHELDLHVSFSLTAFR